MNKTATSRPGAGAAALIRILSGILILTASVPVFAADDFDVTVHAQYRPRFYYHQGHDFKPGSDRALVRHRARLGAGLTYKKLVGVYTEVQDVRTFGEEKNTLGDFSADGFDMHQAYAHIHPFEGMELRVGRQEIAIENHRLIGTVGWTEQARSFDAVRATYTWQKVKADAFWARIAEDFAAANPSDVDLVAVNLRWAAHPWISVAGIGVVDMTRATDHTRGTIGVLLDGGGCGFHYAAEGYYQTGSEENGVDFAAYLAAIKVGYKAPVAWTPFVDVFAEFVSGDDDPTDKTMRSFNTLFATNHKFYGEMDFFLNLPVHTGGQGLMDLGAVVGVKPLENLLAKVTVHHFRAMETPGGAGDTFGTELDLRVNYAPIPHLKIDVVYGVFLPGEILEPAGKSEPEHLLFTTLDVGF